MGRIARILLLFVTCCFALAIATDAMAQQERWRAGPPPNDKPPQSAIDEARRRYQKARKLYNAEGAIEAALAEMQRAYDLAPSYKVLYNLGQIARTGRDYALALHAYERYLSDGGDNVSADRKAEVADEIKELKTYVATVTVTVNVAGATILLDDLEVGASPLAEPIVVNAGRVRLRAVKGPQQDSKTVVLAGGDTRSVELTLAGGAAATPPSTQPPEVDPQPPGDPGPTPDEPTTSNPYLWIGLAATGVFAIGATVTGVLALTNSNSLEDELYAGREPPDAIADKQDLITALAITTDVLIGAAAVSLAVTGVFAILGLGAEPDQDQGGQATWTLTPLVPGAGAQQRPAAGCWGLAVTGGF